MKIGLKPSPLECKQANDNRGIDAWTKDGYNGIQNAKFKTPRSIFAFLVHINIMYTNEKSIIVYSCIHQTIALR